MKKRVVVLVALLFTSVFPLFAQQGQQAPVKQIFSYILEDFDAESRTRDWIVKGSRYSAAGFPKVAYASHRPRALYLTTEESKNYQILGVSAEFDRLGYNYFEIIPVEKTTQQYSPITIRGFCESIDLWVWGALYDYELEVCLEDHNGIVYRVSLGMLNFKGWQNFNVKIPYTIPQYVKEIPHNRPLKLTKFIVTAASKARVDSFYMYMDQIKIVTNESFEEFDGDELIRPDKIEEIWKGK